MSEKRESIVLRVGVATDPAALAGAIYNNLREGKLVKARAFGSSANYQMGKAVHIAHEFFRGHGKELYTQLDSRSEHIGGDSIRVFTVSFFVLDEALKG